MNIGVIPTTEVRPGSSPSAARSIMGLRMGLPGGAAGTAACEDLSETALAPLEKPGAVQDGPG